MKAKTLLLLLALLLTGNLFAKNIQAFLTYCQFYSPESGTYIETYIAVNNHTVTFALNDNAKYQAAVDVALIFYRNDSVKSFKRYKVLSQEVADTNNLPSDFIDQQRILIPPGTYNFEIDIADAHAPENNFNVVEVITVKDPYNKLLISGIQLLDTFYKVEAPTEISKAGYNLVPFVYAFYPEHREWISMYAEIYNSHLAFGEDGMFALDIYIEGFETKQRINSIVRPLSRESAAEVISVFQSFDIKKLATGNYLLVVEVRDSKNTPIMREFAFFQRYNPGYQITLDDIATVDVENTFVDNYNDIDQLAEYIMSLEPISGEMEKIFADNQLRNADITLMQQYLYNFWLTRDAADPESRWKEYHEQVIRVNNSFGSSIKKGYESDRGRIYLKYGEPDNIIQSPHEPMAYPYEIWHYYTLPPNQSNKKFVFVNYNIVTKDMELAHSNAIGEMNDPQWHLKLHSRASNIETNVDRTEYDTHYGSKALQLFNNPY